MQVLLDHGAPRGLARELPGHSVSLARSMGWDRLSNGDLLSAAEKAGFDVLLTTDGNIRYQQNLSSRKIAIVVLCGSTKWSSVRRHSPQIAEAIRVASPSSYAEVRIPFEQTPIR